ncbi:MAG: hypothetical protein SGI92_28745 [Bryobacteraceae bacterium]|nr:hypothetical protein [Bryobacteraceae bacterium]
MKRSSRSSWRLPDASRVPPVESTTTAPFDVGFRPQLEVIPDWPSLDEAVRVLSQRYEAEFGHEAWIQAGGVLDADGHHTFVPTSSIGIEIAAYYWSLERRFCYLDESGLAWAVVAPSSPAEEFGVALGGDGSGFLFGPVSRSSINCRVHPELERVRQAALSGQQPERSREEILADQLVSYQTAAVLPTQLWAAYIVLGSRQQTIDERLLAETLWGDDPDLWPRRWHERLYDAFTLLNIIELRRVRFVAGCWRPELSGSQRLFDSLRRTGPKELDLELSPLFVQFLGS